MNKTNVEIRRAAKRAGVSLGEIARALNCDEDKLAKWLRDGLPANIKQRIMRYINAKRKSMEEC